mgnify:FL=1
MKRRGNFPVWRFFFAAFDILQSWACRLQERCFKHMLYSFDPCTKNASEPKTFQSDFLYHSKHYFAAINFFATSVSAQSTAPPAAPRTVLWDRPTNFQS